MTSVPTRDDFQIFYKDWGPKTAQPIFFHHLPHRMRTTHAELVNAELLSFIAA